MDRWRVRMARPVTFTKAQVRRAVEAAASTGRPVRGFRVMPDGTIEVEFGESQPISSGQADKALAASWDDV